MAKCVVHVGKDKGLSAGNAMENERRGWDEESYRRKNENPINNYDWSRHLLNFEIVDGKIVPLGIQKDSLYERYQKVLTDLGYKEYKAGATNKQNSYVEIIVSGDTAVMQRLAFGNQAVNYDRNPEVWKNWNIRRYGGIERWAFDTYNFFCRRYGKENIIGFEVHLDETAPHAHVNIVPTALMKQRGNVGGYVKVDADGKPVTYKKGKHVGEVIKLSKSKFEPLSDEKKNEYRPAERGTVRTISYATHFGDSKAERSQKLSELHDEYFAQVGVKYGLERGDVWANLSPEDRRQRRHKTKEDAFREKEARKAAEEAEERKEMAERKATEKEARGKQLDKENNLKKALGDLMDRNNNRRLAEGKRLDEDNEQKKKVGIQLENDNSQKIEEGKRLDKELKRIIADIGDKAQKLLKAKDDLREVHQEMTLTERDNEELQHQKEGLRAEIKQLQGEKDETLRSTDAASRENEELRRENETFRSARIGRQNVGDYIKPIDEILFTVGDLRQELRSALARHPRIVNNTPMTVKELEEISEELVAKALGQRSVFSPKKTDEEVMAILRDKKSILLKVVGKQQKDGIMMASQKIYKDVRQQISAVTHKNVQLNQFLSAFPLDSVRIVADSCVRQLKQQGCDLVEQARTKVGTVADELGMGLAEAASRAASIAACLIFGYDNGATDISESCGGGGGSTSGWSGRDKDEKDWQFFGRCLSTAIGMMMPRRKLQGRGIKR